MSDQQPLISPENLPPAQDTPPLSADASIQAALGLFETHMRDEGFAINTMKAFASDVRLQMSVEKNGLFVLGDESRLRWALGNLVDNEGVNTTHFSLAGQISGHWPTHWRNRHQ